MTRSTLIDSLPQAADGGRYDPISMIFHWLTALAVAGVFGLAWAREHAGGADPAWLLALHRTLGIAIWVTTLFRLAWKAGFGRHPSLLDGSSRIMRLLGRAMHNLLYALLLLLPITGFLQSIWRGKPFALAVGQVPLLVERSKAAANLFHDIHETGRPCCLRWLACTRSPASITG